MGKLIILFTTSVCEAQEDIFDATVSSEDSLCQMKMTKSQVFGEKVFQIGIVYEKKLMIGDIRTHCQKNCMPLSLFKFEKVCLYGIHGLESFQQIIIFVGLAAV